MLNNQIRLRTVVSVVLSMCIFSFAHAQEKLIFTVDVVRHGDRTPLVSSPEMNKIWPEGAQQLTPKGMHQAYELGVVLRHRYIDKYHLLPKQYDINTMVVRSSNTARTLMTAQSLLFGLYPLGTGPLLNYSTQALPEGLQPIPINTVSRDQDSLLVPNHDKDKAQKLLMTYIFSSPQWIQKDASLRANYSNWSKALDFNITNLFDLIYVSDRLYIEKLYDVCLPKGLQEKDADVIIKAGKWAWLYLASHPKLAPIVGRELARTIKQEIILAAEKRNRSLKYLLFVAHDSTLSAQLTLLGQTLEEIPPYASELNYSLYDVGASTYEVRVTYNQKPLFIKPCRGESCSVSEFSDFIDEQL